MVATLQLFLVLGFDRTALIADALVTTALLAVAAVLIARARRERALAPADVVAEAHSIVAEAAERQPARVA